MTLEKIISQGKEISKGIGKSIKKDLLTVMLAGSMALSPFLGGCGKAINPLGAKINAQVSRSADYNFSGETIQASITPTERPYQKVEVAVQKPGDADFSAYETLIGNGTYTKNLTTSTYGNYKFKFHIVSDKNGTASENIVEVPVYMNEAESDAALEQAINEIGVNAATTTKGEIKDYDINNKKFGPSFNLKGEPVYSDGRIDIRCRGPPTYVGFYYIYIKSSRNDDPPSNIELDGLSPPDGNIKSSPIMSKDEIKSRILQEKNANWSQIIGY